MSLSKKELRELKSKMVEKDQDALKSLRRNKTPTLKAAKKLIKKENFENKKSVVRWNFKVNDLVRVTYGNKEIGLIVSNYEYFSRRVEKNCFFILVDNAVKQIDGRYLRQV